MELYFLMRSGISGRPSTDLSKGTGERRNTAGEFFERKKVSVRIIAATNKNLEDGRRKQFQKRSVLQIERCNYRFTPAEGT